MLKLISAVLFVVMASIVPLHAQSLRDAPSAKQAPSDLRKVIAKETLKIKGASLKLDAKEMDKIRRQTPRSNWSKTETTIMILFAVGVAVLVFLLIKYGKDCIRYENDCNPADENCYCAEYAEESRSQRIVSR